MTAPLPLSGHTAEQEKRLAEIEAAPAAPESAHIVEAVARALWAAIITKWDVENWDDQGEDLRAEYRRLAVAAVIAYADAALPAPAVDECTTHPDGWCLTPSHEHCREPKGHDGQHMAHDSQGRPEYVWTSGDVWDWAPDPEPPVSGARERLAEALEREHHAHYDDAGRVDYLAYANSLLLTVRALMGEHAAAELEKLLPGLDDRASGSRFQAVRIYCRELAIKVRARAAALRAATGEGAS